MVSFSVLVNIRRSAFSSYFFIPFLSGTSDYCFDVFCICSLLLRVGLSPEFSYALG